MNDFDRDLMSLLARYAVRFQDNIDGLSEMVESLANGLGATIAILAGGDPAAIDDLMVGTEAHIHEAAVRKARAARFLEQVRAHRTASQATTLDEILKGAKH